MLDNITYETIPSAKGTEWEQSIKILAKEGNVLRATRDKFLKMKHILAYDGETIVGFINFFSNSKAKEFTLYQMAVDKDYQGNKIGSRLLKRAIKENTNSYIMFCSLAEKNYPIHKIMEGLGFKHFDTKNGYFKYEKHNSRNSRQFKRAVSLKKYGNIISNDVIRSDSAEWAKNKKACINEINILGAEAEVINPNYASREGCWKQGNDDGASILDPYLCLGLLSMYMPKVGREVYNSFGGGVQMGWAAAMLKLNYMATEIRQNQCDANNKIMEVMNHNNTMYKSTVAWLQANSSIYYDPHYKSDLVFSCPPYYKVEDYRDYGGVIPLRELNSMDTYSSYRTGLFNGILQSYRMLKTNRFFIIMISDARLLDGSYAGIVTDTESYMREIGLKIWNRYTYVEPAWNKFGGNSYKNRKTPKRTQSIIIGYKGNKPMETIKKSFKDLSW
jgi:GNAT superfamily N-acetyltransferase